jgi:hypothetical protein
MAAPSALAVFIARAEARELLYRTCEFDLAQALDPLLLYAERSGLYERLGKRGVHELLNRTFKLTGELAL